MGTERAKARQWSTDLAIDRSIEMYKRRIASLMARKVANRIKAEDLGLVDEKK